MNDQELAEYREWLAQQGQPQVSDEELNEYRQWDAQNPAYEEPPFMARVGRGMMDIGQGMEQLYRKGLDLLDVEQEVDSEAYTRRVNEELALYERGRGPDAGFDWGRLVGNVAPMIATGGLAGTVPRAAALGGIEGGAMFSPQGVDSAQKATQVGLGAALGGGTAAVTPHLARGAEKLFNMFSNIGRHSEPVANHVAQTVTQTLDDAGVPTESLSEAMARRIEERVGEAMNAGVDPAAAGRKAVFESLGFTGDAAPTRAQLSRKAAQWRDEQELSKLSGGEAIKQRYINQSNRYDEIVEEMRDSIGGQAQDDIGASLGSFEDILSQWNRSQFEVSDAYKLAREQAPDSTATLDKFKAQVDEFIDIGEDSVSPQIAAAAKLLQSKGMERRGDDIALKELDMEQVENIRKVLVQRMGDAIKKHDPSSVRVVRMLTEALDDDIAGAGDVFAKARQTAKERFKRFGGDSVSGITKGKGNETNFIRNKILSGKPADIEDIKATHFNGDPQAWYDIKGRVYEHLIDKGYQGNAGSESGLFSGKMLGRELHKMGNSRLNAIFTPEELTQLRLMSKSGEWAMSDVPFSGVNTSNTASTLARMGQGTAGFLEKFPIGKQIIGGGKETVNKFKSGAAMKPPKGESVGSQQWKLIQHLFQAANAGVPAAVGGLPARNPVEEY